jgi:hypothetical protein
MRRPLLLAAPVLLLAAPALALTPQELWSAWQVQAADFGVTLSAEVEPGAEGSLTLRNFTRSVDGGPVEPMSADAPVEEVVLRPSEGGAVLIDLGLPERGILPGGDGEVWLEHEGLAITARDAREGIDYEIAADALRIAPLGPESQRTAQDLAFEVSNLRLGVPGQVGPDRTVEASLSLDGFAYVTDIPDPYGLGSRQSGRVQGTMALTGSLTLPEGITLATMDQMSFAQALAGGFAVRVGLETGAGRQETSTTGFPFSYTSTSTNEPGTGSLSFDRSGFVLTGAYEGGTVTVISPDLPVPSLDLSYGPIRAELRVPGGPEVAEARYLFSIESLTAGEGAWAMVDPEGLLPREPASLLIDLAGRTAIDFAAMAVAAEMGTPPPVPVVESLEVRAVELAAAGVRAAGTGSFTFDNSSGVPMPLGSGTARVEGLDRLLDTAGTLGWLSPEQVQQARFALAAFFRPGAAPDTRETSFEFREGGALLVNGLPVR